MGQLNVTAHALVSLETLWSRQQGGAPAGTTPPPAGTAAMAAEIAPLSAPTSLAAQGNVTAHRDVAGPVGGVSDRPVVSPASDMPPAPTPTKPVRKRGPYKKADNGRRKHRPPGRKKK